MLTFIHRDQVFTLRPLTGQDEARLFEVIDADRAHLRQWMDWVDQFQTHADARQFIRKAEDDMELEKRLTLGIFADNRLSGITEMHHWDKSLKMAEIGYWIRKSDQGNGIMLAALRVFINYLFERLQLNRVSILHAAGNIRSARLAELLKFKTEGVLRSSMQIHGKLQDKVVQAILKSEWPETK